MTKTEIQNKLSENNLIIAKSPKSDICYLIEQENKALNIELQALSQTELRNTINHLRKLKLSYSLIAKSLNISVNKVKDLTK